MYYTADTHFGHTGILKFCNRYKYVQTVEEMNELLVERWNERVRPKDTVYHLGDVAFSNFDVLKRLNGYKRLIYGNHDYKHRYKLTEYFNEVETEQIILDRKQEICLCHYPIYDWPHRFHKWIHLHGHTHGLRPQYDTRSVDVGVDCWELYPAHIDEIRERIKGRLDESS